ncbi:MAG: hypothetical protein ACHQ2Z_04805 [Elusimicrobiota bacterium]
MSFLREMRLPGLRMLNNVRITRGEVSLAPGAGSLPPCPDGMSLAEVPSIARLGAGDRVLAEIDQDGFFFAREEDDRAIFNRRDVFQPRNRYALQVVLYSGTVCVKKIFRHNRPLGLRGGIHHFLGESFYGEAAALLRLRGVAGVPVLRGLDRSERALYMDFIRGETLRHRLGATGRAIFDNEVAGDPELSRLSESEIERYEIALLGKEGIVTGEIRKKVARLAREINRKGVALLDVKPGNVLVGEKTSAVYLVDFEQAQLSSFTGYQAKLEEQYRLFRDWFGIDLIQSERAQRD